VMDGTGDIYVLTSGGGATFGQLPDATKQMQLRRVVFKNIDTSGSITLQPAPGQTIDTATTSVTLGPGQAIELYPDRAIIGRWLSGLSGAGGAVVPATSGGFRAVAASTTFTLADQIVSTDTTAAVFTTTLPVIGTGVGLAPAGFRAILKRKATGSANNLNVDPTVNSIDGVLGVYAVTSDGGALRLVSDGIGDWETW